MIPRFKPDLRWHDLLVLRPSGGNGIEAFERDFARLAGQKEAIAFPYGRTALLLLVKALHLQERNEIICPSYTCVVVPHAITLSGHVPVFVDCAADGYNMDWDFVEQATNEKTGAVVATSLFGCPVDLAALARYRERHPGVLIIQDCAHSFMASAGGKPVHQEGIAAFYGLNISKIITSIFGGMVTTNDSKLAQALRELRAGEIKKPSFVKSVSRGLYLAAAYAAFHRPVYGVVNRLERAGFLARFATYYDPAKIDVPPDAFLGMCAVEAMTGRLQCARYDAVVAHRRKIAAIYLAQLGGIENLALPQDIAGATWSHFVIRTPLAKGIIAHFLKKSIQLGELIEYEIPDMPAYHDSPYFGQRRSRELPGRVVNLPVHVGVSERDAMRIAAMLRHYATENAG